jgi:hypothetical protein
MGARSPLARRQSRHRALAPPRGLRPRRRDLPPSGCLPVPRASSVAVGAT